ncbi:MAG: queuosine precursor transporter [Chloroflexi bacterium]|nr:queuosine precursor transporter [Chloroflexota bacterium]
MNNQRSGNEGPAAYRYFDLVMAAFVAVILISNVASSKFLVFGPFTFDGGTLLFPVSYIFGDILTEVYGYRSARRVIWAGFAAAALMAGTFALVGALPSAPGWTKQEAYSAILGTTPRIVLGSLIAYWAGSFSNAYIMAKIKVLTRGRWLWMRTISSTLVGEGVDSLLFMVIAFYGTLPASTLWAGIVSNYVFKCGVEAIMTPVTYWVVRALKRAESLEIYDRLTDFNPFKLFDKRTVNNE